MENLLNPVVWPVILGFCVIGIFLGLLIAANMLTEVYSPDPVWMIQVERVHQDLHSEHRYYYHDYFYAAHDYKTIYKPQAGIEECGCCHTKVSLHVLRRETANPGQFKPYEVSDVSI